MPLFPKHPQSLAIELVVTNMLHKSFEAVLIPKKADLSLEMDQVRKSTLHLMFFEVAVECEDDPSKDSVDTLKLSVIGGKLLPDLHTMIPKEKISDGLLSSPLKCPSGLRQLSFPGSIPLIHLPLGKNAAFSISLIRVFSIRVSPVTCRQLTRMLSDLMSGWRHFGMRNRGCCEKRAHLGVPHL